MKISFLVTYYNQQEYVKQSLDSVLALEKPGEWEILVGDDGSSDGTAAAVREYIDADPEHIRLFVMPREAGVRYDPVRRAGANRLNLLEHCTGGCFCSLDGDDFYTDTAFVKEAAEILEEHPDVSVVSFGFRTYRNGAFEEEHLFPEGTEGRMATDDYVRGLYIHSGACVHRVIRDPEAFARIREAGSFDDNDIVMNSLRYGCMFQVRRAVYAYRQTDGSVYNTMSPLEKAVLNVQGYDINLKLIGEGHRDALLARYVSPLTMVYYARKRLRQELGEDVFRKYEEGCRGQEASLCGKLLRYPELDGKDKAAVRALVRRAARLRPAPAVKMRIRRALRGILK